MLQLNLGMILKRLSFGIGAEEEEPVDLEVVSTDATIADYCKKLGIETPF